MPGRRFAISCCILTALASFHLLTLRQGHAWGDDFAMYIRHAANIVSGVPYADTGYIYNLDRPELGPRTYPPVFPLLLAPVYKLSGLNLTALKIEVAALLIAALGALFFAFEERLSFASRCALVLLVGLNPVVWQAKDLINSDIPFVALIYLSLRVIEKSYPLAGVPKVSAAILVGFLIYLAYGARTVGLILIPALLLYDFLRYRRPTVFAAAAVGFCGILILAQNALLPPDGSYLDNVKPALPALVLSNARLYASAMSEFLGNGFSRPAALALFACVSGLAALGYLDRLRKGIGMFEIFPILYAPVIAAWPLNQGVRLLLPLAPLYVYYVFLGIERLAAIAPAAAAKSGRVLLAAAVIVSYAGAYSRLDFGPNREGPGTPDFAELCSYIRNNTAPASRFIFRKPRALALFTGRSAAIYSDPRDPAHLWRYIQAIGADYIVAGQVFEDDRRYLVPFVTRFEDRLHLVYSNSDFKMYRIQPGGARAPQPSGQARSSP
jgi:hypothetical protein